MSKFAKTVNTTSLESAAGSRHKLLYTRQTISILFFITQGRCSQAFMQTAGAGNGWGRTKKMTKLPLPPEPQRSEPKPYGATRAEAHSEQIRDSKAEIILLRMAVGKQQSEIDELKDMLKMTRTPIDITKPLMTRDGQPVTNLRKSRNATWPIEGVVGLQWRCWTASGADDLNCDTPYDLVYATRKKSTALTAGLAELSKEHNKMADASALKKSRKPMRLLDQAWAEMNAEFGSIGVATDEYSRGYDCGVSAMVNRALEIIEKLGGMDPLQRGKE